MKKIVTILASVAISISILSSCGGDKKNASDLMADSLLKTDSTGISDKDILTIITTIPNPVSMSSLLQKSKVKYSSTLLNPSTNLSKYTTNFKKGLNMGIYGTDLVHMNIYDRTTSALQYLNSIQSLAKDLGVEKFFDTETLNRLSENSKNTDSVLFITSRGFDRMNQFLQENNRTSISVLIGLGTWIESLYLSTNCESFGDKKMLYERVGDQKYVLDNILMILDKYKADKTFKDLYTDMDLLKKQFDKVQIEIQYAPPTTEIVDGMPVTIDNSKSTVKMTDELFKEIGKVVKDVRTKIIS